jgi:predicted RNA-binding protein (TIGR00451 family)
MSCINDDILNKLRSIADYQFGKGAGKKIIPSNITIFYSKRTGKVRQIYLKGELLATLIPTSGFFKLTIEGAKKLFEKNKVSVLWVKVNDFAAKFVENGHDVFAQHIIDIDENIRPLEEVIVLNEKNKIIAVGKAILTGKETRYFKNGIAVKVRRGIIKKDKSKNKDKLVGEVNIAKSKSS